MNTGTKKKGSPRGEWRPWTEQEKTELRKLRKTHPISEIANLLGRTVRAVRHMGIQLGLKKIRKNWTQDEIDFLKSNYECSRTSELALHLKRPPCSIRTMARRLGLKKSQGRDTVREFHNPKWETTAHNKQFDQVLKELHAKFSNPQIASLLGKTAPWVVSQYRRLGLTRDPETVRKRRTENLGGDLPPEIRELVDLRRRLVRKLNEQSKNHRNAA